MFSLKDILEPWRSFLREIDEAAKEEVSPRVHGGICRHSALRVFPAYLGY
jgi:hypothetical protein